MFYAKALVVICTLIFDYSFMLNPYHAAKPLSAKFLVCNKNQVISKSFKVGKIIV